MFRPFVFIVPVTFLISSGSIVYTALFSLVFMLLYRKVNSTVFLLSLGFLCISLLAILSSILNDNLPFQIDSTKFLIFTFAIICSSSVDLSRVREDSALFIYICTAYSIVIMLIYGDVGVQQDGIIYAPDKNNLAIMLTFVLPFALRPGYSKKNFILIFCVSLYAILVESRGALLLVIFTVLFINRVGVKGFLYAGIAILSIYLVFSALFSSALSNVNQLGNYSDNVRLLIWLASIDYLANSPNIWLGYGGGNFLGEVNVILPRKLEVQHAHNLFLEVAVSYGIIASVILFFSIAYVACLVIKSGQRSLIIPIIVFFSFSVIETMMSDSRVFIVIAFYFGIIIRLIKNNEHIDVKIRSETRRAS